MTTEVPAASGPRPVASGPRRNPAEIARLRELARRVRIESVRAVARAKAGHPGGSLSSTDLLVALYFSELNIRPDEPHWDGRDRYVHSKGHSCEALYATMALRGYFPIEELETFGHVDSRLQGHPDMTSLPGLDMSSGALGVGFTASVGIAMGSRLRGSSERTYVMLGDGECQEGVVWEAAFIAGRYHLDNLLAIVDFNQLQQTGWATSDPTKREAPWEYEALAGHWAAAGWAVHETDGHDLVAILDSFDRARTVKGRPVVIIARTIKGKGVSFMEGNSLWHARVPTADELAQAVQELDEAI
ncbi:MAG TPA: transketolase [Candidatus Deferrimicrobium sp.]|nr:transketolase [Candidatus Deferrimicrobium sp.]